MINKYTFYLLIIIFGVSYAHALTIRECPIVPVENLLKHVGKDKIKLNGKEWNLKFQKRDVDKAGSFPAFEEFLKEDSAQIEIIHSGIAYRELLIEECTYFIRSPNYISYFILTSTYEN